MSLKEDSLYVLASLWFCSETDKYFSCMHKALMSLYIYIYIYIYI